MVSYDKRLKNCYVLNAHILHPSLKRQGFHFITQFYRNKKCEAEHIMYQLVSSYSLKIKICHELYKGINLYLLI